MIVYPNAKINLGLHVQNKGSDGYHEIETVFFPVGLSDILEIIPSDDDVFLFESSGISIPGDAAENLCVKAFDLLKQDYKIPQIKMHLHKIIPMGSGLGGGSSDGAFTLKALNELFSLNIDEVKLMEYAAMLGSDCPFFIKNVPSFGFGRGEKLEPVNLDLSDYKLMIVVPPVHINTAKAYALIDAQRANQKEDIFRNIHKACHIINVVESGPAAWNSLIENDFETPVFAISPKIASVKNKLYENGAVYASMSGSGSAVYGIFRKDTQVFPGFGDYFTWIS